MNHSALLRLARRVDLMWTDDKVTRELYGHAQPVLNEKATLRALAFAYTASHTASLTQDQADAALVVLRSRAADRLAKTKGK